MFNQQLVKHINSLKIKKYRNKYSEFIAEGEKIIAELIHEGLILKHLFADSETAEKLLNTLSKENAEKLIVCSENDLNKITTLQHHHNCIAIFLIPPFSDVIDENAWILALDDIQDPGNMGSIIRTCDWFGIKHIVCSEGCVDVYNPKVVQASMASVGRVHIFETNLVEYLNRQKRKIYGAVLNGENYMQTPFSEKGIILIGNEGKGIRPELLSIINVPITIPRIGKAESLNASIATALIISTALNYRTKF